MTFTQLFMESQSLSIQPAKTVDALTSHCYFIFYFCEESINKGYRNTIYITLAVPVSVICNLYIPKQKRNFVGFLCSTLFWERKSLMLQEVLDLKTCKDIGLKKIWEEIQPVWKMNNEDLVNVIASRIIYEDGQA